MSKVELGAKIEGIFTPLGLRRYAALPVGGGQTLDPRYGAIVLVELAWIELYRLVDSFLDMQP